MLAALAVLFFASLNPGTARAQTVQDLQDSLVLEEGQERYRLGPSLYVTQNPGVPFNFDNYQKMIDRHLAGDRGDEYKGNVFNLGTAGKPHWIVFSVDNRSQTQKWVLSFGQRADGRVGLVDELFLRDYDGKQTYIKTLKSSKSPDAHEKKSVGASTVLDIPPGKKSLIFAYIVPRPGMPATLAPELMTERAYTLKTTGLLGQTHLFSFFMILVCGFFLAAILFRQMWSGIIFISYFLVLLLLFRHQNDFIRTGLPMAEHIPGLLFNLSVIIGLVMSRFFLGIGKLHRLQGRLIFTLAFVLIASAATATFLIADELPSQIMVMYFPPIAALFFLFMLSLAQGYTEQSEGYLLATGWLAVLIGACISFVSLMNIFVPSAFMINAYWYGIVIQGILLISATVARLVLEERKQELVMQEQQQEQQSVTGIMQSKEASENSRLLRMIEHERELMNELRIREAQQNVETRKAKEDAILANNAKSAFLAVISHEIRTPMTGIMGMVRFLLETKLTKEQKGYAQTLQDSGEAMLSLLNDILDFEKIESGRMDLEHIDFDLHRLLNGVKTLMTGHAETKNIALKVNIHPEVPRYVIGDPVRLRQVILNLTGNSIKFTNTGGVTVDIKPDRLMPGSGAGSAQRIRFSVIDTGVGITKEGQKKLFNPFSQADSAVARKFGGTGLGLAISQKLIQSMGGSIEIDSTPGHGSTFFFTLTMQQGSAEAVEKAEAAGAQTQQKPSKVLKILIVEDNDISQKLMKELVDRMGHETCTAGSGEESIEILKNRDLDLILMDIQLPGMTGMGTTKAIRALPDRVKAGVPVIALTGNVKDEDVRQCYAANMNGHIAKPIDPKRLKDQISKVIDGRLDNPVELSQEKRDRHTQVTQLSVGTEKFGPGASLPLQTEDEKGGSDKVKKPAKTLKDSRDEIAPITALAMGHAPATFSDDELDEDSFEAALNISERSNGRANGSASAEILNHDMIESLRSKVGQAKFDSLLSEMAGKADSLLDAIEEASRIKDMPQLAARAHELKGMAGNFGLTEVSRLSAKAEMAAKNNEEAELQKLVAGLSAAHTRALEALKEWKGG